MVSAKYQKKATIMITKFKSNKEELLEPIASTA